MGYLCETLGTLEAIKRTDRANYFDNRRPTTDVQITQSVTTATVTITFATKHDLHPGLPSVLRDRLQTARALGFRLLPVPRVNISLPNEFRSDQDFYEAAAFASMDYNERFGTAAAEIESRGAGGAVLAGIAQRIGGRLAPAERRLCTGLLSHAKDDAERSEIIRAVAEWADGDLVASHIAIGNDLLCTEDLGKSAPEQSVFGPVSRAWLTATYGVQFVNTPELVAALAG